VYCRGRGIPTGLRQVFMKGTGLGRDVTTRHLPVPAGLPAGLFKGTVGLYLYTISFKPPHSFDITQLLYNFDPPLSID